MESRCSQISPADSGHFTSVRAGELKQEDAVCLFTYIGKRWHTPIRYHKGFV